MQGRGLYPGFVLPDELKSRGTEGSAGLRGDQQPVEKPGATGNHPGAGTSRGLYSQSSQPARSLGGQRPDHLLTRVVFFYSFKQNSDWDVGAWSWRHP